MSDRKKDHINQAFHARVGKDAADQRFNYEPLLAAHPVGRPTPFCFAGKTMRLPLCISSMTGGTPQAGNINRNLARACNEFGLGMGLGSCRVLLEDESYLNDFNLRNIIGEASPFYANLGIAQLENLIEKKAADKIPRLIDLLQADGIIIHINPLQEAFQPEGEVFKRPPLDTLQEFLNAIPNTRVIVKEVGQGMGPESIKQLLRLPIEAIELGALGGTNFTLLELLRSKDGDLAAFESFAQIGHTAEEMTRMINEVVSKTNQYLCKQVIISGGITNILDGYYLQKISKLPSVIGMGSALLKMATGEYEELRNYLQQVEKSYQLATAYLKVRTSI
ncbi:MAG: hypothetical protein PHI32_06760 [Dysgonamonadaceae bacterium]|nr:hypothetical protein [Dysgonamonadaceae bacterium]